MHTRNDAREIGVPRTAGGAQQKTRARKRTSTTSRGDTSVHSRVLRADPQSRAQLLDGVFIGRLQSRRDREITRVKDPTIWFVAKTG